MTDRPGRITRREFGRLTVAGLVAGRVLPGMVAAQAGRPVPTPPQLEWQRDELAIFLHFGVNTFTDSEWGDGTENPAIFAPNALDARQWARTAKAGGARAMVLTAKHHDGFCLWPSATTKQALPRARSGEGRAMS